MHAFYSDRIIGFILSYISNDGTIDSIGTTDKGGGVSCLVYEQLVKFFIEGQLLLCILCRFLFEWIGKNCTPYLKYRSWYNRAK